MEAEHILSYGGGVNTTALMVLLVEEEMPFDEAIFADTGAELPETYKNLRMATAYLKDHGIPLRIVKSKKGTLYDTCKRRRVFPSEIWRWSTRDFKVIPIHAYYRSLKTHIYEYLGIAYDEVGRMKASKEPYITSLFPLIDRRLTRDDCIRIIKNADLPIPVKSGCFFCPFNSIERWKEIYENHRDLYMKSIEIEENSKHFPSQKLTKLTLRGLMVEKFSGGSKPDNEIPLQACGAYCMA